MTKHHDQRCTVRFFGNLKGNVEETDLKMHRISNLQTIYIILVTW